MDWAIVVTGVVGLAGIGGSIVSARMASTSAAANLQTNIAAEERRAKVAEKRLIYARYLTSITEVVAAAGNLEIYGGEADPGDRQALVVRVNQSVVALMNALSEVQLVAPPKDVGPRADDMGRATNEYANKVLRGEESRADFYSLRQALVGAMRADLGEALPETALQPADGQSTAGTS
jgi:hypothetical protein